MYGLLSPGTSSQSGGYSSKWLVSGEPLNKNAVIQLEKQPQNVMDMIGHNHYLAGEKQTF